ncbi:hypothetical protein ACFL1X_12480 [Candidatus Hydrogenedentota bacterium]
MAKNPLIRNIKQASSKPLDHQSAGILDDHAIRKNIASKEGTMEQVPTEDNHIVNKKYVDDEVHWDKTAGVISPKVATDEVTIPTTLNLTANAGGNLKFGASGEQIIENNDAQKIWKFVNSEEDADTWFTNNDGGVTWDAMYFDGSTTAIAFRHTVPAHPVDFNGRFYANDAAASTVGQFATDNQLFGAGILLDSGTTPSANDYLLATTGPSDTGGAGNFALMTGVGVPLFTVDITGDFNWIGSTSGFQFGAEYGNNIGWTQSNMVQNTWYNISDSSMTTGEINGSVSGDGNGKLTAGKAGKYLINYSVCYICNADVLIHTGIEVNGSGTANVAGRALSQSGTNDKSLSGTAILDIAANQTIEIAIMTSTAGGTVDIEVSCLNLNITQLGGT